MDRTPPLRRGSSKATEATRHRVTRWMWGAAGIWMPAGGWVTSGSGPSSSATFGKDLRFHSAAGAWVGTRNVSHDAVVKRSGERFVEFMKHTWGAADARDESQQVCSVPDVVLDGRHASGCVTVLRRAIEAACPLRCLDASCVWHALDTTRAGAGLGDDPGSKPVLAAQRCPRSARGSSRCHRCAAVRRLEEASERICRRCS
jgi:hypothetical protein